MSVLGVMTAVTVVAGPLRVRVEGAGVCSDVTIACTGARVAVMVITLDTTLAWYDGPGEDVGTLEPDAAEIAGAGLVGVGEGLEAVEDEDEHSPLVRFAHAILVVFA